MEHQEIETVINRSIIELFELLFTMDVIPSEPGGNADLEGARFIGGIDFAGEISGSVRLAIGRELGICMTNQLLGTGDEHIPAEADIRKTMLDAMLIIGDELMSSFINKGLQVFASFPFLVGGADFSNMGGAGRENRRNGFLRENHFFFVENNLKYSSFWSRIDTEQFFREGGKTKGENKDAIRALHSRIEQYVADVFQKIFGLSVDLLGTLEDRELLNGGITVGIGLAGSISGRVSMRMPERLLRMLVTHLFGGESDEKKMLDAIPGVAGRTVAAVADAVIRDTKNSGVLIFKTSPFIIKGNDYNVWEKYSDSTENYRFITDGIPFSVSVTAVSSDEFTSPETESDGEKPGDSKINPALEGENRILQNREEEIPRDVMDNPDSMEEPERKGKESGSFFSDFDKYDFLFNVPIDVKVELGRTRKKIRELLEIRKGTLLLLNDLEDEPVNILINDRLVAKGRVLVENGKFEIEILRKKSEWKKKNPA